MQYITENFVIEGNMRIINYIGDNWKCEIPSNITHIDPETFNNGHKLMRIDANKENEYFTSEDGVLFNKDKTTLIRYPINKSNKFYEIPRGVTHINKFAFCGCNNLNKISLPQTLKTIDDSAFSKTALKSVTIPQNAFKIGKDAFNLCYELESVDMSKTSIKKIEKSTFYACKQLKSVKFPICLELIDSFAFADCSKLYNVENADSIAKINACAFQYCNKLKETSFPNAIKHRNAFLNHDNINGIDC